MDRTGLAADAEKGPDGGDVDLAADDANEVWWDGDDDPQNPFNWPLWQKMLNCVIISVMTFVTPLGSCKSFAIHTCSDVRTQLLYYARACFADLPPFFPLAIFAPGVPEVMSNFGSSSRTLASFVVSVYLIGFAFGPLLIAPLSEIYGRVMVYHVANVGFVIFCVACALAPSLDALIVFRFFCGTFGCAAVTNGGGTIADMVRQESRGLAMSLYSVRCFYKPWILSHTTSILTHKTHRLALSLVPSSAP